MTKKIKTDLTWDDLLSDSRGPELIDGKTIKELVAERGNELGASATRRRLEQLAKEGVVEVGWKRTVHNGSGPTKALAYKIIK